MRFAALIITTLLLFAASLFFGAVSIPAGDVASLLAGEGCADPALRFIVLDSRLPQALTALLAGAGLSLTGLMLQTAFRNPLAGPSVLGITSGAGLGVAIVMLLFGGTLTLDNMTIGGYAASVAGALAGSLAVMAILIAISSVVKNDLMLLIAGIMTGYLTSSVVTLLSSLATARGIQGYVYWGMGTFGDVAMPQIPLFALVVGGGIVMSLLLAKPLNILLLGENYAVNLGLNMPLIRGVLLLATGIITAAVTAYCGPISFIGVAVPHIARFIFRTDNHRVLMPATLLIGAATTLACNVVSTLPESNVIPVNALTALVGVPVVLAVIFRRR